MSQTDALIEEATSPDRRRKMVQVFDELSDSLCKVADLAEFVRIAHPDRDFSEAAEDACIAISGVVEKYNSIYLYSLNFNLFSFVFITHRLNTHKELHNSLLNVVKNGDVVPTSDIDKHVAELFVFDFEQCGIHLAEEQRRKVVQLNDKILQVNQ